MDRIHIIKTLQWTQDMIRYGGNASECIEDLEEIIDELKREQFQIATTGSKWVGLTDEDMEEAYNKHAKYQEEEMNLSGWYEYAEAIEAKLKEKNHAP